MKLLLLTNLLTTTSFVLALALENPGEPNPINSQSDLDTCKIERTVTHAYFTATAQKGGACPEDNWKVGTLGCCGSDMAAKTLGVGVACCPCGTSCTGYMPAMVTDWAGGSWKRDDGIDGAQITAAPTVVAKYAVKKEF